MSVTSVCYAPMCGHVVIGEARTCPRCGGRMRSPGTVRALGMVMMACGVFIIAVMGTVTYYTTPLLSAAGASYGGDSFNGDADQARMILQFFWLVIAFGLAATAAGAWQTVTARRNRWVTVSVLALAGLLFFAARATEFSLA